MIVARCLCNGGEQRCGRQSLQQHRRCANPHRETEHAAQPEGECQRRRAAEHIVGVRAQHMAREGVAHRQHIAMKMHRALRLPGSAGGECDQCDVIGGGVKGRKSGWPAIQSPFKRVYGSARIASVVRLVGMGSVVEIEVLPEDRAGSLRQNHFVLQCPIAKRRANLGLVDDFGELLWLATSGMVGTAIKPAFTTASQQAAIIG